MKSLRRRSTLVAAYTLIEVLVAMSIIALAIAAASQLSLSQALTEDVTQRETMAVNYAENTARLWQLGVISNSPAPFLLASPNSDNSLMTCTVGTSSNVDSGEDNSSIPIQVDRVTVSVAWAPPGKGSATTLNFTTSRLKPERR